MNAATLAGRLRGATAIAANQAVTVAGGIVGLLLLSHLVPPAAFGTYSVLMTLAQLGPLVSHAGWFNAATRGWSAESTGGAAWFRDLALAGARRVALLAALLAVGTAVLAWRGVDASGLALLPLLVVAATSLAAQAAAAGLLNAAERHDRVLAAGAVASAARALLPAGAVVAFGVSVPWLVGGVTLANLLAAVAATLLLLPVARGAIAAAPPREAEPARWRTERRAFDRAFPVMGGLLWCLEAGDRWLVLTSRGEETGGLFALAFVLGLMPATLAAGALLQGGFPKVYRLVDEGRDADAIRLCDRLLLAYLGLVALGTAAVVLLVPLLVHLGLIGERFAPAAAWIPAAAAAAAVSRVIQFHCLLGQARKQPGRLVGAWVVLAAGKLAISATALAFGWTAYLAVQPVLLVVAALVGRSWLVCDFRCSTGNRIRS